MEDQAVMHPQSAEMTIRKTKGFNCKERVVGKFISKLKDQEKVNVAAVQI